MLFQIVQLIYWLALSTWFGSVLFIALAAPIIFKTVRENNPVLSHVLSVNMDGQHSTLLAGSIVFALIQRLFQVELICGATLLLMLVVQPFVINLTGNNQTGAVIRSVLFLLCASAVFYDWQVLWPRIKINRSEYIDHADEPEVANPARDRFDGAQRASLTVLSVTAALLLGMILFSSTMTPPPTFVMQTAAKPAN